MNLKKCIWWLCISLIPSTIQAQHSDQWISWNKAKDLPVKEGLSNTITGISNGVLIVAGGSNFNQPIQEGGQKIIHDRRMGRRSDFLFDHRGIKG